MKCTVELGEILRDHELKAFVHALQCASDYDRCVRVSQIGNTIEFELLTIDQEAEMETEK
jgi:hypothetical protein